MAKNIFTGQSIGKGNIFTKPSSSSTKGFNVNSQTANYKKRLASSGLNPDDATDKRNWLEKALNLEKDQNVLFDIFEILGRPQNAIFGGIESMQEGGSFGEGLKEGIKGERKTSGKDLLVNAGMDDTEGKLDLSDVLGFGLDVFADPIDLALIPVTMGGSAAAKAGIKGGAEGLKAGTKGLKAIDTASDVAKGVKATDKAVDTLRAGAKLADKSGQITRAAEGTTKFISPAEALLRGAGKGIKKGAKISDNVIEKTLERLDKKAMNQVDNLVKQGMSKSQALSEVGKRVDKLDTYKALKEGVKRTFDSSKNLGGLLGKGRDIENLADFNEATGRIAIKELDDKVRAVAKGDEKVYNDIAKNINTLVEADYDWAIKGDEILDVIKPNKKVDLFSKENADNLVNALQGYGINATADGRYVKVASQAGDNKLNLLRNDKQLREKFSKLDFGKRLSKEDLDDIKNARKFFDSNPEYRALYDEARNKVTNIARNSDTLTGLNAASITKEGYVPHVLTDDAKEVLNKKGLGGNNQFNARKYQMTTNEANRFKQAELKAKKANISESIEKKSTNWFQTDKDGNIKLDSNGNAVRNEATYNDMVSSKQIKVDNLKKQRDTTNELLKFSEGKEYDISKLSKKDREIVELATKQDELRESIKKLKNINYVDIDNVQAITGANKALTQYNRAQKKLQTAIKNGVSGDKLNKIKDSVDIASKEVRLQVQSLEKYANKEARNAVKEANKAFKEGRNVGIDLQKQTDMFYRNGETINESFKAASDISEKLSKRIELAEADLRRVVDSKDKIFAKKYEEIGKLKEANNILSDPENFEFFSNNFMDNIGTYVERNARFSRGAQIYNEALTRGILDNPDYIKMASDLKDGKIPHNFVKVNGGYLKGKLDKFKGILPENSKSLTDVINKYGNKDIYMDKDLANLLRVAPTTSDIHPLLKVIDGINNTFKKFSTLSLGFQARNIIGNGTNMVLSGMPASKLPEYYTKASSLWNKADDLYQKFATKGIDAFTDAEKADWNILKQFQEAGFVNAAIKGQGFDDIVKANKGILNKVSKKSIELNNKMDSFNRLALLMYANDNPKYIQKLGKKNAIEAVRYALFDPNNMSSFEKNVMKRAMPFYTFTKQNLLFQADNIMRNTPRYNRLFKGLNNLYRGVGEERYFDYQKNNMQIPLPFTDSNGNTLFIKANLPLSDLGEFMSSPIQRTVSSTSPLIKAPFELATGVDTFTGQAANNKTYSDVLSKMGINAPTGVNNSLGVAESLLKSMGMTNVTTNMVKKVSKVIDKAKGEDVSGSEIWAEIFRSVLQNTNEDKIATSRAYEDLESYQNYIKQLKNQGIDVPTIRELNQQSKRTLRNVKNRRNIFSK